MNAKEYLENNHWPESHAFSRDDVVNLMESYHKAKSKEEAEERLVDYVDYMIALTKYIELIGAELDETSVLAYTHGWRSDRVELGKEMRSELNRRAKELLLPEPFGKEEQK